MALIPGYTPTSDTEQFTWAKFRTAFTNGSALITGQSQITPGVITVSNSAPAGKQGDAWFDTSAGTGSGILRILNGSDWMPVAEGMVCQNKSGVTVGIGAPMKHDATVTTPTSFARVAMRRTTLQTDRMVGVAATEMAAEEIGVVLTRGKVRVAKDAASITSGDPVVPSTTAAQATTNAVGSWGVPFGSSSCGFWLESSSAAAGTLVTAYLTGHTGASWLAWKATPNKLVNAASPTALATWQTAVSWATSPAGTVAHMVQIFAKGTGASANVGVVVGVRPNGSSLTITDGVPFVSAEILETADDAGGLFDTLWVPMGADNSFQWYFDSVGGAITNVEAQVTIWEVAAMVGGQVV